MNVSKIIAALLGPTFIVTAVSLLVNLRGSALIIESLLKSPALVMIAGYAAFVPGVAILYFHNRWRGWPALVSALGWLFLIVGALRIVFPVEIVELASAAYEIGSNVFLGFAIVFLLIGGFLSYKAYGPDQTR